MLRTLILIAVVAAGGQPMSALLQTALARHPEMRLIRPDLDFPDGYTEKEIKGLGYWPPWFQHDMDRDGRQDVAAAVEVDSAGQARFGVIAVFAASKDSVRWVVAPQQHWIFGVADGYSRGSVTPLFCLECDANGWFTWSGRAFEPELYVVGDSVAVGTYTGSAKLPVFDAPKSTARVVGKVSPCTRGLVEKVAGTAIERWYLVRLERRGSAAWVPDSTTLPVDCPDH